MRCFTVLLKSFEFISSTEAAELCNSFAALQRETKIAFIFWLLKHLLLHTLQSTLRFTSDFVSASTDYLVTVSGVCFTITPTILFCLLFKAALYLFYEDPVILDAADTRLQNCSIRAPYIFYISQDIYFLMSGGMLYANVAAFCCWDNMMA